MPENWRPHENALRALEGARTHIDKAITALTTPDSQGAYLGSPEALGHIEYAKERLRQAEYNAGPR